MSEPPRGEGQPDAQPVEIRDSQGFVVGDGNRQTNYFFVGDEAAERVRIRFSGKVDSPYRGLLAFEEDHAAFFFGREEAADEILRRLRARAGGPGLMVVSGVSGAGKSSLLQAGVLPRLAEVSPAGVAWPHVVLTPARAPLNELAAHAAQLVTADAATLHRALRDDPSSFALIAREAAGSGRLVLVVDQFEQVSTQCDDDVEREAFITALHAAATMGRGPRQVPAAMVILAVRADFEAQYADHVKLTDAVQGRYLLPRMTESQLRLAITEPARVASSSVDNALVTALVQEIGTGTGSAGVLPHLSYALDQAWRSRDDDTLTLADYHRTGGIAGAVAVSAQRAYEGLTPGQQSAAQQVFTRLTATTQDGTDTADRASRAELTAGQGPGRARDIESVVEVFAAERLLTLASDTVEISHEVLLTAWPLLRDTWLAQTHADRIVRTRLHTVAAEWVRDSHDPSYLYSGSLLETATGLADRVAADPVRNPPLPPAERDFLRASDRARGRRVLRRRAAFGGLALLTLSAAVTAGFAVSNAARANQQHTVALSRQLAAEALTVQTSAPWTAARLAVDAWAVDPTDQAGSALTTMLIQQQQQGVVPDGAAVHGFFGSVFSPDGKLLATSDLDGTVRLWDPVTGQAVGAPLRPPGGGSVTAVAFSPDGKLLAAADSDGTVRLLDPGTGHQVGSPLQAGSGRADKLTAVAFSPDGKLLAAGDSHGTVRLLDPGTGQQVGSPLQAGTASDDKVTYLAFSRDRRRLATGDLHGYLRLWDPASGQQVGAPYPATATNDRVYSAAFSPDGKLLAAADSDGTVRLLDPGTGHDARTPLGSGTSVVTVAYSPDGKTVAAGDADGTVRLLDTTTGREVGPSLRSSNRAGLLAMTFSPDGELLALTFTDGSAQVWVPATGRALHAPYPADPSPGGGVYGVAASPDGKLVASADVDGTVRLWNPVDGQLMATTPATPHPTGSVFGVAFSPDGKLLAAANSNGTVGLFDSSTGAPASTRTVRSNLLHSGHSSTASFPLPSPGGSVFGVAFSPDGKLLAAADVDGSVLVWNLAKGTQVGASPLPADPAGSVNAAAFSPDGEVLASAESDGTVRLWNLATGKLAGPSIPADTSAGGAVLAVAFSPDGKLLASADSDGTVRLWDPATSKPAGPPITAVTAARPVYGVAFSPDGKLLASADSDGTVRLWDPATSKPVGPPIDADSTGLPVNGVVFSPDGKLLFSADAAGAVDPWQVPLFKDPYAALCTDAGSATRAEFAQYAPGEKQPHACS